jgi:hypothetical protein
LKSSWAMVLGTLRDDETLRIALAKLLGPSRGRAGGRRIDSRAASATASAFACARAHPCGRKEPVSLTTALIGLEG